MWATLIASWSPVLAIPLVGLYWSRKVISKYTRKLVLRMRYKAGPRMDAEKQAREYRSAADTILNGLDSLFISDTISGETRYKILKDLCRVPGLAKEFQSVNKLQLLKEEIIARRGTAEKKMQHVKPLPFPDAGKEYYSCRRRPMFTLIMGKRKAA